MKYLSSANKIDENTVEQDLYDSLINHERKTPVWKHQTFQQSKDQKNV